jgi:hypothetical protein
VNDPTQGGRLTRHGLVGEIRRVPDYRMLWKWNSLIRFANFFTINSFLSNGGELRLQSSHVVGFSLENRPPQTRREGVS